MPSMDFSEVLNSKEFQDSFEVIETTSGSDIHGERVVERVHEHKLRGPVIPGKQSLRRLEDGSRVNAYIDIYCRHELTIGFKFDDARWRDADLIRWHGRLYTVMSVEDYSRFGRGFFKASCDLLPLNLQKGEEHRERRSQ